jgi:hypothetical protein
MAKLPESEEQISKSDVRKITQTTYEQFHVGPNLTRAGLTLLVLSQLLLFSNTILERRQKR